jgi:hypothetical protein
VRRAAFLRHSQSPEYQLALSTTAALDRLISGKLREHGQRPLGQKRSSISVTQKSHWDDQAGLEGARQRRRWGDNRQNGPAAAAIWKTHTGLPSMMLMPVGEGVRMALIILNPAAL